MYRKEIRTLLKKIFSNEFIIMKGSIVQYKIPSGKKGVIPYNYLSFNQNKKTNNRYIHDVKTAKIWTDNYKYVKRIIDQIAFDNIKELKTHKNV